ncbi:hypothetical protein ACTXT7_004212 [Hymenolepis weldensis]
MEYLNSRKAPTLPMLQKFRKAAPPPPPPPPLSPSMTTPFRDEGEFSKSNLAHFSTSIDAGNLEAGLSEHLIKSPPTISCSGRGSTNASVMLGLEGDKVFVH